MSKHLHTNGWFVYTIASLTNILSMKISEQQLLQNQQNLSAQLRKHFMNCRYQAHRRLRLLVAGEVIIVVADYQPS